jgi:protein-tyrosine phosphatase
MTLILFVCRGNTCRSPMAEVAARATGMNKHFGSAGVAVNAPDSPADPRAIAHVATFGLDLTRHRTRPVSPDLLATAEHIYVLDRAVLIHLHLTMPASLHPRITLLLDVVPQLGLQDVDDPWSGGAADYARAFDLIQLAVAALDTAPKAFG